MEPQIPILLPSTPVDLVCCFLSKLKGYAHCFKEVGLYDTVFSFCVWSLLHGIMFLGFTHVLTWTVLHGF